ncbi:MAG TPA: exodeoxyribonuclease VII small subunit [Bacillota bacterium]|jgi:exodeoxyribonuclease VII small subunit|nr:exodeoxyribonuclease VII small subunit [Peptococcaceae bacterium MAG4]NLW38874.1 exodeoxyribonuclease VII small subunit [Peptococcaceae bacterium]HPZ42513.1 exodeoxyribonuclease VII small subunit [Bacillota bacterium]HQD76168.1 exodeoxyribonuclease VII small subunit [Bacillota bacterium]HUM57740.1 exodeoxyribonuclease VII small subunit [Bacillota bacterium]
MAGKIKEMSFEEAIARLEEIVKELEDGRLPLESALVLFEEGVKLSRICEGYLEAAEQKISILLEDEKGRVTLKEVDSLPSPGGGKNHEF